MRENHCHWLLILAAFVFSRSVNRFGMHDASVSFNFNQNPNYNENLIKKKKKNWYRQGLGLRGGARCGAYWPAGSAFQWRSSAERAARRGVGRQMVCELTHQLCAHFPINTDEKERGRERELRTKHRVVGAAWSWSRGWVGMRDKSLKVSQKRICMRNWISLMAFKKDARKYKKKHANLEHQLSYTSLSNLPP